MKISTLSTRITLRISFALLALVSHICPAEIVATATPSVSAFPVIYRGETTTLLVDQKDAEVVHIAAKLLAQDIQQICDTAPNVLNSHDKVTTDTAIIAGTIGKSSIIDQLIASEKIDISPIKGKWEACIITTIKNPTPSLKQALVVIGSDRRGTAYGLMDISRAIGISPWIWWADAHPEKKSQLHLTANFHVEQGPSIKFRGIFINDEDWSLIPWIKKTYDPELGNIGPKTYTKIFELMLRLKSNYMWPAMHGCSSHFNAYPENAKIADDYAIIMGSSHCEPLLRNNVKEWKPWSPPNHAKKGGWNYFTNEQQLNQYWNERILTNGSYENVYTIGMRGIHDGGMPGGKNNIEKARKLEQVFDFQRKIIASGTDKAAKLPPQIFCPYKEVMYVYDAGLKVPEDVMICWAEDNQGYMRRLPDSNERQRSGRHGLYYHLSYWSDYLWLSTISPQLISYELTKAAEFSVDQLWVFNVGDIKISEKELDFAMDLAWDTSAWGAEKSHQWPALWAKETFGPDHAQEIGNILNEFYRLAYRGKPEHIGHVRYSRSEIKQRLKDYTTIAKQCDAIRKNLPARLQDAFTHLVYYPVVACKFHNDKILLARLSLDSQNQGDSQKALKLAEQSKQSWEKVKSLTEEYNATANGKWNHIMSWHPRNLKVFGMPPVAKPSNEGESAIAIKLNLSKAKLTAPMTRENGAIFGTSPRLEKRKSGGKAEMKFDIPKNGTYHIYAEALAPSVKEDSFYFLFNGKDELIMNKAATHHQWKWIHVGTVNLTQGSQSLTVSQREPNAQLRNILITSQRKTFVSFPNEPTKVLTVSQRTNQGNGSAVRQLKIASGLGPDNTGAYSLPHLADPIPASEVATAPFLEFKTNMTQGSHRLRIKCLPSHPVNKGRGLRMSISVNGAKATIYDVKYKETFHNHHDCRKTLTLSTEPDLIGYIFADHSVNIPQDQECTIRISLLDPALIFYRIECF